MGCENFTRKYNHYDFKVGMRDLDSKSLDFGTGLSGKCSGKISEGLMHHCLFYDDEIFELLKDGYHRRNKSDCNDFNKYKWNSELEGTSCFSPNDLDKYIKDNGNLKYDPINNNCQHFVKFCLEKLKDYPYREPDQLNEVVEKYKEKMCCK